MLKLTGSNHSTRTIHPGMRLCWSLVAGTLTLIAQAAGLCDAPKSDGKPAAPSPPLYPPAIKGESLEIAKEHSAGCQTCHLRSDQATMHASTAVVIGCTDCHGGNAAITAAGLDRSSAAYAA